MMSLASKLVLGFFCALAAFVVRVDSQSPASLTPISIILPSSCNSTYQYFDISHLSCMSCPTNSVPKDTYNCKCNSNAYYVMNNGGGSVTCALCPTNFIQSLDGFNCVFCDATCQTCVNSGGYRTDSAPNGSPLVDPTTGYLLTQCYNCDTVNSLQLSDGCTSCKPVIFAETSNITATKCNVVSKQSGGMLLVDLPTSQVPNYFNVAFGSDTSVYSWYFGEYLVAAWETCRLPGKRNVTACQALGNMCVLNLYNYLSSNIDPCQSFASVVSNGGTASNSIYTGVWPDNMPWLNYFESYNQYLLNYQSYGTSNTANKYITLQFENNNRCGTNILSFYAAKYNLDGVMVSFDAININKLNLCILTQASANLYFSPFSATNYYQTCTVSVQSLLDLSTRENFFYDLYLKYDSSSNMIPIPLKILNYKDRTTGIEVNRNTDFTNQRLQRRLFLTDAISSKTSASGSAKYIRYPSYIGININLVNGEVDGSIYPPVFVIDYAFASTTDLNKQVPITFQVQYSMDLIAQIEAIWISIGILLFIVFIWSVFRTFVWNRRSGKIFDLVSIFKFFMYIVTGISNIFILVAIVISIYWLIFYKGQTIAFALIPQGSFQEASFIALLVIGFVFKALDILHIILVQCSFDIFFIDWERPKLDVGAHVLPPIEKKSNPNQNESKEKLIKDSFVQQTQVSCWRTLFVANEWNEIQTFRKINPTIQLIFVLLFLKVVNLEAITTADCNTSIIPNPNNYQAAYSSILREAMAASMFLGVGLVQWFVYHFFYTRCIQDKLGQFVDFCSVANISMFIMTHTQFGYYIHGRSPHGNADTNMQHMSLALQKEENDSTPKRGLEHGTDHQTFSISVSYKLSKQYAKVIAPLYIRKTGKGVAAKTSDLEQRMNAYSQMNRFLIAFIDNVLREMKYIIVKRNFIENVLDFEFQTPLLNGYFYQDDGNSFQRALVCGKERAFFLFDLITFMFFDYFCQNYVLAALITFIIIKIYETLRSDLGKRNISRKTLVDKRFLI